MRLRIRSLDDPKLLELRKVNIKAYSNIVDYLFTVPTTFISQGKLHEKLTDRIKQAFIKEENTFEQAVEEARKVMSSNIDRMLDTLDLGDKDREKKLKAFNKSIEEKIDILLKPKYNTNLLALPKSVKNIPNWVIPLIDIDEILKNNLSTFLPLFASVGGRTVQFTKDDKFVTNIIL